MAIPNGTNTPLTIEQRYGKKQAQSIGLQNQRFQQGASSSVLGVLPGNNQTVAQQLQTANAKFGSGLAHQEGNPNASYISTPASSPTIPQSFITGKTDTSKTTQAGGKSGLSTYQAQPISKQTTTQADKNAIIKTQEGWKKSTAQTNISKSQPNMTIGGIANTNAGLVTQIGSKLTNSSDNYRAGSFSPQMIMAAKEMKKSNNPATVAIANIYLAAKDLADAYEKNSAVSSILNIEKPNFGQMIAQAVFSTPSDAAKLVGGSAMGAWATAKNTVQNLKDSKSALGIVKAVQSNMNIMGESTAFIGGKVVESATTDPERFAANLIGGAITGGVTGGVAKGVVKGVTSSVAKSAAKSTIKGVKSAVGTAGKSVSNAAAKTAIGVKSGANAVGKSVSNAAKSTSAGVKSAKTTIATKSAAKQARKEYSSGKSKQIAPSVAENKNTPVYVQNTQKLSSKQIQTIVNNKPANTATSVSGNRFSAQAQRYAAKQPVQVQNAIIQAWNNGQRITITSAKKIARETRSQTRNTQKQISNGHNQTRMLLEEKTGTNRQNRSSNTQKRAGSNVRNLTPQEQRAANIVFKYHSLILLMKKLVENSKSKNTKIKIDDIYTKNERKAINDFNKELNEFINKLSPEETAILSKYYPQGLTVNTFEEAKALLKAFNKQKTIISKLDTELIGILFRNKNGQLGFANKVTKEQYNFIKNLSPEEKVYLISEWRRGNKFTLNEARGLIQYFRTNRDKLKIDSKQIIDTSKPTYTDKEIKSILNNANEVTEFINSLSPEEVKLINDYFSIDLKTVKSNVGGGSSSTKKQTAPVNDNTQGVGVGNQIMAVKTKSKPTQKSPKITPPQSQKSVNKPTAKPANKSQNQISGTTQKSQTKSQSTVSVSVQSKKTSSKTTKPSTQKQTSKSKPGSNKMFVLPPLTVNTNENKVKTIPALKIIIDIPENVITATPGLDSETETQTQNAYVEAFQDVIEEADTNRTQTGKTNAALNYATSYAENYATAFAESYAESRAQKKDKKTARKIAIAYATAYATKTTRKTNTPAKFKKDTKSKSKTIPVLRTTKPTKPKVKSLTTSPKTRKKITKKTKTTKRTYYQRINWDEGEFPWLMKNLPMMKIPAKH